MDVKKKHTEQNGGIRNHNIIRITGIIIFIYFLTLSLYFFTTKEINFISWKNLFDNILIKILTMATIISISLHGFIGIWQITTDYIKQMALRYAIQAGVLTLLISYVFFGVKILWGA